MSNELRFVFERGNYRIEELDFEGDVIKDLKADGGTVKGFFKVYEKQEHNGNIIGTIDELEEIAQNQ